MKKQMALVTLALAGMTGSALALDGGYVGGDIASDKMDGYQRKLGMGGFVGYNFGPALGMEFAAARTGDLPNGKGEEIVGGSLQLSGVLRHALTSEWTVYGRAGLSFLYAVRTPGSAPSGEARSRMYALGVTYKLNPTTEVRTEYSSPAADWRRLSVGIAFNW